MNFGQAIKGGFKNYVNFRGTAGRAEYWYWVLFTAIVSTVLGMIDNAIGGAANMVVTGSSYGNPQFKLLGDIWNFSTLLPSLGLFVRRLRDAGYSLKRLWLYAIPVALAAFAVLGGLPALISQAGHFETGNLNWAPFLFAGLLFLLSGVSAVVVGILFIVWLCQPSKQPQEQPAQSSDLPEFINPPGHPDTNTQY